MSASPFNYRTIELHTTSDFIIGFTYKDNDLIIKDMLNDKSLNIDCMLISDAFMFQDRMHLGGRAVIRYLLDLSSYDKVGFYKEIDEDDDELPNAYEAYDKLIILANQFKDIFKLDDYSSRNVINKLFPHN